MRFCSFRLFLVNVVSQRWIISVLVFFFFFDNVVAEESVVERRKDQFPTSSGRLLAPIPYSMPGLGKGFFILGHFGNLFSTTTDLTILKATGDIQGQDANFDEIPIINNRLYLRAEFLDLSSAQQNYYNSRGMDTEKDDYTLLDINSYKQQNYGLDLTFYERRLTFSVNRNLSKGSLDAVRDPDGNIISEFSDPYEFDNNATQWSVLVDLTDDYLDPNTGFRAKLSYQNNPANSRKDPKYYVTELDIAYYLPFRKTDTFVFNFFQSDAHVTREGDTDRTAIANELNFNCDPGDAKCLETEASVIENFVNERAHGNATSLGGFNRLRAFPGSRFNGAHASTIGAEYRMNFVRDATPFDFSIWKDTHTGLQLAFFYEMGTVSELTKDLWKETRYVIGSGARLVTFSGTVYRFDLAFGDEGVQPNLFFYYPWN